jgi:hypothetical protein
MYSLEKLHQKNRIRNYNIKELLIIKNHISKTEWDSIQTPQQKSHPTQL